MLTLPVLHRPWIFDDLADLADLTDSGLYAFEVVEGSLLVSPRPANHHDEVVWALFRQLEAQATPGWEPRVELAVRLGSDGRAADVGLLSTDRVAVPGRVGWLPREVGLLVEVVSPGSRRTDRMIKPAEYAEAGVPFFWRLETDPAIRLATYRLVDAAYVADIEAEAGIVAAPGPVPLRVDLDALPC